MRVARNIELRLERFVEGLSAALFRGRMHPVDLANRLVRFVDLHVGDGPAGPEIANEYTVRVSPSEIDEHVDLGALGVELAAAVIATAAEQGWRLGGPVRVAVVRDPSTPAGSIRCEAAAAPGALPAWGQLIGGDGTAYELADNRMIVGRSGDADVIIPHERVSRRHALLSRSAGAIWIEDLESANGTSVNGTPVGTSAVDLHPGDVVSLGPATFTLRLL